MAASRLRSLLVAVTLVAAACTAQGVASPPNPTAPAPTIGSSAAPSPSPIAYPLTLTDDEGAAVTIPAAPHKIVSLTPANTEILFAIGAGADVVATTDFDDYPPEAVALPDVATYTSVDVEKIVGLGADLVVAGGNAFNPPEAIARLRSLKVPVVVTYPPTVADVLDDIRLIGQAAGHPAEATALAGTMAGQFEAVRSATSGAARPKVFYEIDASSKIYTAADQSFLAEMISIAGGDPITTGSTTAYDIPLEKLITADPEVILLGDGAYGVTADQVKTRPGWGTIAAVKSGSILAVNDIVITRPGPRLVQGLMDLVRAIHPELVLPSGLPMPEPSLAASPVPS